MAMSNTLVRIITAIVAVPAVVFVILQGGWWFAGFVMLISSVALWEYYRLAEVKGAHPNMPLGIIANLGLMYMMQHYFYGDSWLGSHYGIFLLLGFAAIFVLLVQGIELWRGLENPTYNTATTVGGVGYISFFMASLIALRGFHVISETPQGKELFEGAFTTDWGGKFILMVFVSIWICDSAAYFIGKAFGRHKLFLRVSPGKSWEGAIAGFLFAIAAFTIMVTWLMPGFPLHHAIILGALIGSISQVGDLAKSLLKRDVGVKDSSNIIPGHGGVLDRFDSILFISPTVLVYLLFMLLF